MKSFLIGFQALLDEVEEGQRRIDDIQAQLNDPNKKLTKKEIQKLEKMQQREQNRQAQAQARQQMIKEREEKEAKREAEQAKRDEKDRLKEEEEQKLEEEKLRKEKEEFERWKSMMQVEEAGEAAEDDKDHENQLTRFIDYIERRKVVMMEDVAAEFKMMTQDVVARIEQLQGSGRLTGITDDRGKFIHITEQEYNTMSEYIKSRGRVSRAELLREVNKVVRLVPTESDQKKLREEQREVLSKVEASMQTDNK